MDKKTSRIFDGTKDEICRYICTVDDEFSSFAGAIERANARYTPDYARAEIDQAAQISRGRIASAFEQLMTKWQEAKGQLEQAAAEYIMRPVDPAFIANLRLYREFGLQISRRELDALILTAAGGYNALRALSSVARESGFVVTCPDAETYSKDLQTLQSEIESLERYRPEGAGMRETASALGRQMTLPKNRLFDPADPVDFVLVWQSSKMIGKYIDEISERWTSQFVPEITVDVKPGISREEAKKALEDAENEHIQAKQAAAAAVEVTRNDAERMASQIGKARREADERARDTIEHFVNGGR